MKYYAMSDIHGCYDAFEKALGSIDLADPSTVLVLLGDYLNRGPESQRVVRRAMQLQEQYRERVIALRGNHEEMFLEWVLGSDDPDMARAWMLSDPDLATTQSFLSPAEFEELRHLAFRRKFEGAYQFAAHCVRQSHRDVLRWMKSLPYYHETKTQIFVHAGIDEEAESLWRVGTAMSFSRRCLPVTADRHLRKTSLQATYPPSE